MALADRDRKTGRRKLKLDRPATRYSQRVAGIRKWNGFQPIFLVACVNAKACSQNVYVSWNHNKPISILLHRWSLAVCGIRWHFGSKKLGFLLFPLTEVLSLVSSLLD